MILDELHLQNFCLYKGLHSFELAPTQAAGRSRPITLFGGMNGAGKTTILDAVQLALYGARARSANRMGKSYEEYLRESIHRGASPVEGTSVSIKFRYHAEGKENSYEVSRGWSLRDKVIKERVRVTKDDVEDSFLSENWNDLVEDLIPIGISQLFFFDAEKVRFLADDETDTTALGAAIKSLLGLDLAERLIADAAIVERRLTNDPQDQASDKQVEALHQKLDAKVTELTTARAERASVENPLLRARRDMERAKAEFVAKGGEHWAKRSQLQAELQASESNVQTAEAELRDFSALDLPLLLVPGLLAAIKTRDSLEQANENNSAFHDALKIRDKKIIRDAREAKLPVKSLDALQRILDSDRKSRIVPKPNEIVLDLSGHARATLGRLLGGGIDELQRAIRKTLVRLKSQQVKREGTYRLLNAAPADESIALLVERLKLSAELVGSLEGNAKRIDERIDVLERERNKIDVELVDLRKYAVNQTIEQSEASRMAKLAQRTQSTMREFLQRATARKIERLSELVTHSFQFLLRKQSLVAQVQIHPETFRIDLFDDKGISIPKARLSEGEKQIFAIALLWGLAQASPRQLPSIIDTPMARLDSEHRGFLVERYFPNASHQVIILSTDTEIEREYFEQLKPSLARSYHLVYDEEQRATKNDVGYFWNEAEGAST